MRSDLTLSGGLAGQELYLPKPKLLRMLRKSQSSFSSIFMRLRMAKAQPNMIGLLLILISLSITVLTAAGAFHGTLRCCDHRFSKNYSIVLYCTEIGRRA